MTIASQFIDTIPANEVPEQTTGYEGFFHLHTMEGKVEQTLLKYIIRDHDMELFQQRKETMKSAAEKINNELGKEAIKVEIKDQYFNMREKVEPVMYIVDIAEEVMEDLNITPLIKPIS